MIPEPERWLDEHGEALYAYAILHLADAHRAEDLVQETLLAGLEARWRFRGLASVRTWLTGILKHKIMDEYRRVRRESLQQCALDDGSDPASPADDADFAGNGRWQCPPADWGDPEKALSGERFWLSIERCMKQLPPRMAHLFLLRELWQMETEDLCAEMRISPANLWTTLHRARLKMRRCLEQHYLYGGDHGADV